MALDNDLWLYLPFTKVDESERTVTGIAIGDNLDKQGDIVKFDATEKAFDEWQGNIREMHMPKAVGKAISHRAVKVMQTMLFMSLVLLIIQLTLCRKLLWLSK